jgi:hypothetical protein
MARVLRKAGYIVRARVELERASGLADNPAAYKQVRVAMFWLALSAFEGRAALGHLRCLAAMWSGRGTRVLAAARPQ